MRPRLLLAVVAICFSLASLVVMAETNGDRTQRHVPRALHHAASRTVAQATARKRRSRRRARSTTVSPKPTSGSTSGSPTPATPSSQPPTSRGPLSGVTYELPIRTPIAGEEQLQGLLTRVECPSQSVIFTVKAAERTLRLWTPSLNRVQFRTYTPDVSGDMTCGPRTPANNVVVTFRADARAKFDGTVVAIEFVPKDFVKK